MKSKILTAFFCALLMIIATAAQAKESEPDPLKVFVEDLCNEEAVRVMVLEMAEFMAAASYNQSIASTGVSLEAFVDDVVAQMEEKMKDEIIEFEYCNVDEVKAVDCAAAAELIEQMDDFKYDQIIDALDYLKVAECAAALFSLREKDSGVTTRSIAIAGNTDGFWRLLIVTDVPPTLDDE